MALEDATFRQSYHSTHNHCIFPHFLMHSILKLDHSRRIPPTFTTSAQLLSHFHRLAEKQSCAPSLLWCCSLWNTWHVEPFNRSLFFSSFLLLSFFIPSLLYDLSFRRIMANSNRLFCVLALLFSEPFLASCQLIN